MKTLKVVNGDFVIENGEFQLVSGDEEIAQGVEMNLTIRKEEFVLDEHIGLDRTNIETKNYNEEEIIGDILEALQPMTDPDIIEGVENVVFSVAKKTRTANISSMEIIKPDGTNFSLKGVELANGTD